MKFSQIFDNQFKVLFKFKIDMVYDSHVRNNRCGPGT